MAPPMQNETAEDQGMIGLLIAAAGALLLISAGKGRRLATQPVRNNNRKR